MPRLVHRLTRPLAALLAGVFLTAAGTANAQSQYPDRPVKILVPFAVGGLADLLARTLAQKISEEDDPVKFGRFMNAEQQRWAEVIRTAKISADQ